MKILMCPPSHFEIEYEINPWMHKDVPVDHKLAKTEWDTLKGAIELAGGEVVEMNPAEHLPDMVFTANGAFITGNTAIVANFANTERSGEEEHFEALFKALKFDVVKSSLVFEGAGDALFDHHRKIVFMGYGQGRTQLSASSVINSYLDTDYKLICVHLTDPLFYHVDTALCPLDTGHILYYPGALDELANRAIETLYSPEYRIPVYKPDAYKFACNAVSISESIILPRVSTELVEDLESRGLSATPVAMSEFMKAGGGCKCLTLKI